MSDPNQIPLRRPVNVPDFVAKAATDVPQPKEKYPTEVVPLATKGWFYPEGHPLSSGEIELKQMTAREEDLLANQELIKKGKVLDKLMEALVVNKSIRLTDMLIPDKNALFIDIRRLAYGDDYNVEITCPSCEKKNKIQINLSELKTKDYDYTSHPRGHNSFTAKLPSGTTVTYKLINQIDEDSIEAELTQLKKISKENSADLTTRLKYIITSIDGNTDRVAIRKFIDERLTAKDSLALRRHMKDNNPGLDMSFDYKCPDCEFERRLDMPLGASFLWPDLEA